MKTLDEVIEAMERCSIPHYFDCKGCPYEDDDAEVGCRSDDRDADVLQYLKAYKDDRNDLTALRAYWAEQQANPPLSWEQLKQREGKPVWVELLKGKWKGWDVIGGFDEDDFGVAMVTVRGDDYYKADLGKTWQAYRKERE